MIDLEMEMDAPQLRGLLRAVDGLAAGVQKHLPPVINETAKKTRTRMKGQLTEGTNVKAGQITKRGRLKITKRANKRSMGATVTLRKSTRLSLKDFKGTRQTAAGVSYQIENTRKVRPGGFMGPRPGQKAARLNGHAFRRLGNSRHPIAILHGASPWALYVGNKMDAQLEKTIDIEFSKAVDRRIRAIVNGFVKQ